MKTFYRLLILVLVASMMPGIFEGAASRVHATSPWQDTETDMDNPSDEDSVAQPEDENADDRDDNADDEDGNEGDAKPEDGEADGKGSDGNDNKSNDDDNNDKGDPLKGPRALLSRSLLSRDADRTSKFSKQDKKFVSLFEPLVESVGESTVQVYSGGKRILLGMIVSPDGLIVTKASELQGELKCKLHDGRLLSADVYGIHPETDLAMLKIDAEGLVPGVLTDDPTPEIGYWVATPLPEEEPAIGIVSVNVREIPPSSPFIGIIMVDVEERDGVRINSVVPNSPAEDAGLWVNDVILRLDESDTRDIDELRDALGQYDPGERVTLTVLRGQKEKSIKLTLAEKDKISPDNRRSNQQNSMGSKLSRRRKAFPMAFQHDSMLTARNCGGPIVNLDGHVIGLNIARAGRVASLALPVAILNSVILELRTGELAPGIVNREAIERTDKELRELTEKSGHLPDKRNVLQQKLDVELARREELAAILKDVETRLKTLEEKSDGFKQELDIVKQELKATARVKKKLTADLQQLKTGRR